jgi:hypothetical protein
MFEHLRLLHHLKRLLIGPDGLGEFFDVLLQIINGLLDPFIPYLDVPLYLPAPINIFLMLGLHGPLHVIHVDADFAGLPPYDIKALLELISLISQTMLQSSND